MENSAQTPAAPVRKRKKIKAKRAAPAGKVSPVVKEDDELAGLTGTECGFECTAERCVISHLNVCSHPNKGGMQAVVMNDPEALKRYQRARKMLAVQTANKRG